MNDNGNLLNSTVLNYPQAAIDYNQIIGENSIPDSNITTTTDDIGDILGKIISTNSIDIGNANTITNPTYVTSYDPINVIDCLKKESLSEITKNILERLEDNGISVDISTPSSETKGWICVENGISLSGTNLGNIMEPLFYHARNPYFFLKFDKEVWFGEVNVFLLKTESTNSLTILVSSEAPGYYKKDGKLLDELTELALNILK